MANSDNNHGGYFMKLCTAVLTSSEYHYGAKRSSTSALSLSTIAVHMNVLTATCTAKGLKQSDSS